MNKENYLGDKIKQLRKSKGLTQERLAEMVGIDHKHLSRIEKGYHSPKYSILQKLATALDFDLFSHDDIHINQDVTIKKIMTILSSAESEEEKKCYLEAVKQVRKCIKLGKSYENF